MLQSTELQTVVPFCLLISWLLPRGEMWPFGWDVASLNNWLRFKRIKLEFYRTRQKGQKHKHCLGGGGVHAFYGGWNKYSIFIFVVAQNVDQNALLSGFTAELHIWMMLARRRVVFYNIWTREIFYFCGVEVLSNPYLPQEEVSFSLSPGAHTVHKSAAGMHRRASSVSRWWSASPDPHSPKPLRPSVRAPHRTRCLQTPG